LVVALGEIVLDEFAQQVFQVALPLIVLERSVPRPRFRRVDRVVAVALAALTLTWREALLIVQPATAPVAPRRLPRALAMALAAPSPRVPRDTVALIRSMAADLREATAVGEAPRFLLRDRDGKFPETFDLLARVTGIRVIRSAVRAPDMNAVCERFLGSLRRECLDHVLLLSEAHLHRALARYVRYHNEARPPQGLGQRTPVPAARPREGPVIAVPVLDGLHHEYRRAA
jgi:Integrase core domain